MTGGEHATRDRGDEPAPLSTLQRARDVRGDQDIMHPEEQLVLFSTVASPSMYCAFSVFHAPHAVAQKGTSLLHLRHEVAVAQPAFAAVLTCGIAPIGHGKRTLSPVTFPPGSEHRAAGSMLNTHQAKPRNARVAR